MNETGGTIWRRFRWSATIASGAFLLWFVYRYGIGGTGETIPGTTRVWPAVVTPDEDRPHVGIAVVNGIEQPVVSGGGVVSTIDGVTRRWDLDKIHGNGSMHTIYSLGSSLDGAVLARLDDYRLARLDQNGAISIHSIGTIFNLGLDAFGADMDHFVTRESYDDGSYFRCQRSKWESENLQVEDQWTLPVDPVIEWGRKHTVVKASGNRWVALARREVVLGDAMMNRLATLELELDAESILCTGDDEFVLMPGDHFAPVCRLRVHGAVLEIDERWYCGRSVRAEAWSRERGFLLLVKNHPKRTTHRPWGDVSTQIAAIELIDTREWKPVAIHVVETSDDERDLRDLWWEAVFAPDGETLYVMHSDATVHEIDIGTWIKESAHLLQESSFTQR